MFVPDLIGTFLFDAMIGTMLKLRNISKSYAAIQALSGVDIDVAQGEVHVLFGENGAGKSTLIGVMTGLTVPSKGSIEYDGRPIDAMTPARARSLGISAVFQEFSLVPSMTVLDNMFLGREGTRCGLLNRRAMRDEARGIIDELGFGIPLHRPVGSLTRAECQMVEIAKALMVRAKLLILDEPTASLSDVEADHLLETVRQLRSRGVAIVYVSHRMREIKAIADRITVLRSGSRIATIDAAEADEARLVELMTGRRIDALFPVVDHRPAAPALVLDRVSTSGGLRQVSLSVRAGELVGIAGLVGCGKGQVGRAAFGLDQVRSGSITLRGEAIRPASPRQMLAKRLCYLPSDRNEEGLALNRTVTENAVAAALDMPRFRSGWGLAKGAEMQVAGLDAMKRLALRPLRMNALVSGFSGGNRQKIMLARGLVRDIDVFIFDEPTVGIDVGAKVEVYDLMKSLTERGAAVLLISSELSEVLHMSNRIYVMHEGEIVRELVGEARTEANVLEGFFGRSPKTAKELSA